MKLPILCAVLVAAPLAAQGFSLTASSNRVEAGQSVELDWSIPGQGPLRLEPGGLRMPRQGRLIVKPLATTTYQMSEEGLSGPPVAQVLITVLPPPVQVPEVCNFEPSATSVLPGEPVVLRWQCNGASTVRLEPGGLELDGKSEVTVTPLESTRYTLSVYNQLGGASKSVDVKVLATPVKGAAAATCAFDADKKFCYPGDAVTLRWDCAGEAKARLYPSGLELDGKGSVTVTPAATTVYTLSVSNAAGGSSRSLEITVVPRPKPETRADSTAFLREAQLDESLQAGEARRARASKTAWTLRLVVSGRKDGLKDLGRVGGTAAKDFMVLPFIRRDGFRWWQACWGAFPSRAAALKAFAKLPESTRKAFPQPLPFRLDHLPGDPPKD
ncbi:MAG TPA: hypothetical protein VNV60_06945 [Holophagaceae bacterium]|jgi:hypothetical protein|nr:hypothetical protein [Holophagaceae bacterium]